MASPSRFTSGVSIDTKSNILGSHPQPSPYKYHTFFDDFDTYDAAQWNVTFSSTANTLALTDADGGILTAVVASSTAGSVSAQLDAETFTIEDGKQVYFNARIDVDKSTGSGWVVGLTVNDGTPLAVADGVHFRKDAADTNVDFVIAKFGGSTSTTLAIDTFSTGFVEYGFVYDGLGNFDIYKNGSQITTITPSTTAIPTTQIGPSFAIQSGSTAAAVQTLNVDYVFASKERG